MFLNFCKMLYTKLKGERMKVVYIVDSITEINSKIETLKTRFGDNIVYVVKANLATLFKTYGHTANAIYNKNLPTVLSAMLLKSPVEDIIICYSSVKLDNNLLNRFITEIGDKSKVVNVMPTYNGFERMCQGAYNIYVKSLFKAKDSLISPKLQFLPYNMVVELLSTHFSNRLFEIDAKYTKTIYIEDKELSQTLKIDNKISHFQLIPVIAALIISMALIACLAFVSMNYVVILIFVFLYILDFVLAIIFQCKSYFDKRFFNR